jgi:site-specific DNA recombinase
MLRAILYVRVSTDEQAEKGYSQRDQEERLRNWCRINQIEVVDVLFEDHSAKTFLRPQWQSLLNRLKTNKRSNIDHILFTKWDRFSRNAGDAYQMISLLRKLGIDPQAIEQPLDLRVPENKMMLAFYLAAPEVENDRRALNVFHGMRRAKKEGRWVATAPIGYRNVTTPDGRKTIVPDEIKAPLIRWVFEELAIGRFNSEQVWKMAVKRGLKCSKNNFWLAIRNPVYCGKILIPKFENEKAYLAQGLHEPIITTTTFDRVQDVLSGRKRNPFNKPKIVSKDELPLRGFLICPECNRKLSGSASKGKKYYYHYYHCKTPCGVRYKAEEVNEKFKAQLGKLIPRPGRMKIYSELVLARFKEEAQRRNKNRRDLLEELDKINTRMQNARIKMVDGFLSPEDFQQIKETCLKQASELEKKLDSFSSDQVEITHLLKKTLTGLEHLSTIYESGALEEKRQLLGSIFPENLIFDGIEVRTPRLNEGVDLIYQISSKLQGKKNGTNPFKLDLSPVVRPKGFEPLSVVPETTILSIELRAQTSA